ncbi:effector-associated constant component EACC1 [Streptomyces lushanensis]|uniref:effector-associated constant component EACC1 n=1 Tax=Streptomyces lushanensis TaxID=1434255 RepID=UPI0008319F9A|nr:hypothetical protein [Streptomyces lushanensis]
MRVRIEVAAKDGAGVRDGGRDGDGAEVLSLYEWLRDDRDVVRGSALSLVPRARSGADSGAGTHMGPGLDVVEAVFNGSVQLAQLTLAVATWRLARPRPPRVRIERGGTTVTLDSGDPGLIESVERVLRALEGPGSGPGPDSDSDSDSDEPDARAGAGPATGAGTGPGPGPGPGDSGPGDDSGPRTDPGRTDGPRTSAAPE